MLIMSSPPYTKFSYSAAINEEGAKYTACQWYCDNRGQMPLMTHPLHYLQHIAISTCAKTYHHAAANDRVWTRQCNFAVLQIDGCFAGLIGHHVTQVSDVSATTTHFTN